MIISRNVATIHRLNTTKQKKQTRCILDNIIVGPRIAAIPGLCNRIVAVLQVIVRTTIDLYLHGITKGRPHHAIIREDMLLMAAGILISPILANWHTILRLSMGLRRGSIIFAFIIMDHLRLMHNSISVLLALSYHHPHHPSHTSILFREKKYVRRRKLCLPINKPYCRLTRMIRQKRKRGMRLNTRGARPMLTGILAFVIIMDHDRLMHNNLSVLLALSYHHPHHPSLAVLPQPQMGFREKKLVCSRRHTRILFRKKKYVRRRKLCLPINKPYCRLTRMLRKRRKRRMRLPTRRTRTMLTGTICGCKQLK